MFTLALALARHVDVKACAPLVRAVVRPHPHKHVPARGRADRDRDLHPVALVDEPLVGLDDGRVCRVRPALASRLSCVNSLMSVISLSGVPFQ